MAHTILFEHRNFHGAHKHVVGPESNLNASDDGFFNDRTSSIIVLDQTWAFYRNAGFNGQYAHTLGPGRYPWVGDLDIQSDDISSLQPVGFSPPVHLPHAILFEHRSFHGAHKHVFAAEPNLNAGDDGFFNDKVSSLVVVSGRWAFYRNAGFNGQYANVLGPGMYPWVPEQDIQNDDMSSLQPVASAEVPPKAHVILFEHKNFHGQHKHVFGPEPNLNAGDDGFFNDKVSSLVVVSGTWRLYRNSGFNGQYATVLGPGTYPSVESVDIQNDDISSLQPV